MTTGAGTSAFFNARHKKNALAVVDQSLNKGARNKEISRILVANEAMLKRLQNRTSNYNVWSWEHERKAQVKLIKQICLYPPSISKTRRTYRKKTHGLGKQALRDMESKFATGGPNKQMYDMYNMGIRSAQEPALGLSVPAGHYASSEGIGTAPPQPYNDPNRQALFADGNSEGDAPQAAEGPQAGRLQGEEGSVQAQIDAA
jgi:hypothetical protein